MNLLLGISIAGMDFSLQEREIITVASLLTAGGRELQLEVHINYKRFFEYGHPA